MQEVNYAVLAGCAASELLPKIGLVASTIVKEKPDLKGLKRFFKEHDFFDKERFETLLNFLDVDYSGKTVKAGPFLTKLLSIVDPEDRKRALFEHLTNKNQILMKYVMDAIAERLYSTNEMYRYLTSYVYPGTYLTLVDFRYWMNWLEATEHIKVVGIRWGISDLGKSAMEKIIKFIDVDDILDEESGGDDDDDDDDDDDVEEGGGDDDDAAEDGGDDGDDAPAEVAEAPAASEVAAPAAATPAVAAPVAAAAPAAAAPVAAAPVAAPVAAAAPVGAPVYVAAPAASVPISSTHVEVIVQPVVPKADETPLHLVKEAFAAADEEEDEDEEGEMGSAPAVQIGKFRLDEMMVEDNLRAVQVWWQQRPGGRLLTCTDYGFAKEAFDEDALYALFRLSALALQIFRYGGRLNTSKGGQSYAMLDQMGFYSNLIRSTQTVDEILLNLFKGGMANRADDFGNLHYLLIIRKALKDLGEDGVKSLLASEHIADVVMGLWEHIGHFQLTYEILWIARELVALGVVTCDDAQTIGVVPLPKVRETAFRLGFIETPYAADFAHLVSISRRLSKFFGARDAWEAPLVYFDPRRDLRYDSSEPAYFTREQLGID